MKNPKWEMKGKSIQKTNFILETPKDINDFKESEGRQSYIAKPLRRFLHMIYRSPWFMIRMIAYQGKESPS